MPGTVSEPMRGAAGTLAVGDSHAPLSRSLSPAGAALLPLTCAAALAALALVDTAHDSRTLRWSTWAAAAALAAGSAMLAAAARRSGRSLSIEVVARRQHY